MEGTTTSLYRLDGLHRQRRDDEQEQLDFSTSWLYPWIPVEGARAPLLQIPPHLLEKIINKIEEKSYFRLQQTCHSIDDFIHRSRKISVHIERPCTLLWDDKNSCHILKLRLRGKYSKFTRQSVCRSIDVLYGTCISSLAFIDNDADRLCSTLRENRITSKKSKLSIMTNRDDNWGTVEDAKVLNALKCNEIEVQCTGIDPYVFDFQSKYLKKVSLNVEDEVDFAVIAPEVLTRFEEIQFRVGKGTAFELVRIFLTNLTNAPIGNLKLFRVRNRLQRDLKESRLHKFLLDEFNMRIAVREYDEVEARLTLTVELPQTFPSSANLNIVIERWHGLPMSVTYRSQ